MKDSPGRHLVASPMKTSLVNTTVPAFPGLIAHSGPAAQFAWDEFFSGQLRNRHTRVAYMRAV